MISSADSPPSVTDAPAPLSWALRLSMRDRASDNCFFNEAFSFLNTSASTLFAVSKGAGDLPHPTVRNTADRNIPIAARVKCGFDFIIALLVKTLHFTSTTNTALQLAKLHKTK